MARIKIEQVNEYYNAELIYVETITPEEDKGVGNGKIQ